MTNGDTAPGSSGAGGPNGASALDGVRYVEVDGGAGGRGVVAVERSGGVLQQGVDCGFDASGCGQPYFAAGRSGGQIRVKDVREAGGRWR